MKFHKSFYTHNKSSCNLNRKLLPENVFCINLKSKTEVEFSVKDIDQNVNANNLRMIFCLFVS